MSETEKILENVRNYLLGNVDVTPSEEESNLLSLEQLLDLLCNERPKLESEKDCWLFIEQFGGFVWMANHDIADGRCVSSGRGDYHLFLMQRILKLVVDILDEKFGIAYLPNYYPDFSPGESLPPVPEGKRSYGEWYKEHKLQHQKEQFQKTICSVCPFCAKDEPEKYTCIPCGIFPGFVIGRFVPWECVMVDKEICTQKGLNRRLRKEVGEKAVLRFREKTAELKLEWTRKRIEKIKADVLAGRACIKGIKGDMEIFLSDGHEAEIEELLSFVADNDPNLLIELALQFALEC